VRLFEAKQISSKNTCVWNITTAAEVDASNQIIEELARARIRPVRPDAQETIFSLAMNKTCPGTVGGRWSIRKGALIISDFKPRFLSDDRRLLSQMHS